MRFRGFLFAVLLALAPIGARAACAIPNTFVNGTIIDANQVNQNFTTVAGCVNTGNFIPTIATNTVLLATSTATFPVAVMRLGFTSAGDAPPVVYKASGSPCSLNSGSGDNGAQVRSSDGNCWLAVFTGPADIREWGVATGGSTDISAAFNAAVTAAQSKLGFNAISLPYGQYLLNGTGTVALAHVKIVCNATTPDAIATASGTGVGAVGYQGAVFWMTSTSVQPFTVGAGVHIEDCGFYWPNQQGAGATPTSYPPLFTEPSASGIANFDCVRCRVINAYDFIGQTDSTKTYGNIHLTDTYGYAIRYWLSLANTPETITISGMVADWNLFQNVANVGNQYLVKWTAANGAFLHVFGNGNGSTTTSSVMVAGLAMTNSSVFAYQRGIWVENTGFFQESTLSNIIWDAVAQPLRVDAGGCVANVRMGGQYFAYTWLGGGTDNATAFSIGAPASSGCTDSIDIAGRLEQAQGDVLDVSGAHIKDVRLSLASGTTDYASTTTPGTYYFANVNAADAIVDVFGTHVEPAGTPGTSKRGFLFSAATSVTLTGNSFNGVYNPVDMTGISGQPMGAGNAAISTSSPASLVGAGPNVHRLLPSNYWDLPPQPTATACGGTTTTTSRSTDLRGAVAVGATPTTSCEITFAGTFGANPFCQATSAVAAMYVSGLSTTQVIFSTQGGTALAGSAIYYRCDEPSS
jgi:hypothetical protein